MWLLTASSGQGAYDHTYKSSCGCRPDILVIIAVLSLNQKFDLKQKFNPSPNPVRSQEQVIGSLSFGI